MNRWSPLQLREHEPLKNRLVVPPMASSTSSSDGLATPETIDHYQRLAESGAGLVFAEYTYISNQGKSEPNQLGADRDESISGLHKIQKVITQTGALAALQLTHAGGKSSSRLTGEALVSASAVPVPMRTGVGETPKAATLKQIAQIQSDFILAVERAVKAGFQMVELHSAHGYGLNQWLSPLTNHRADAYGGSLLGRSRMLFEIVSQIKNYWPELLLSVRIPGKDGLEDGLSTNDMQIVAKNLETLGVDVLNVSSGLGGWRRPPERRGQGYLVSEAHQIQSAVDVPVIGVGGIVEGEYIDQQLQQNSFQLAAVGRAILENPVEWRQKHLDRQAKAS